MIEITKLKGKFELGDRCNSCLGENRVVKINYFHNENQKSSFRLCLDCRKLMVNKLIAYDPLNDTLDEYKEEIEND